MQVLQFLFLVFASFQTWAEPLEVLVTEPNLEFIVRQVGGEEVKVTSLVEGFQDPHHLELKPSFYVRLKRAQLFVAEGSGLESAWLGRLLATAKAVNKLTCVEALSQALKIDSSQIPAHLTLDPYFASELGPVLADAIGKLIPVERRAALQLRGSRFKESIVAKIQEYRKQLEGKELGRLATYHEALDPFLNRMRIQKELSLEPPSGFPMTAKTIQQKIELLEKANVSRVLVEGYFDLNSVRSVFRKLNFQSVPVSLGDPKGPQSLIQLYDEIIKVLLQRVETSLISSPLFFGV